MAAVYSRVTVIGRRRRMDAVLPVDEPLGRLLPDLLRMLDEPLESAPRRRFLTTAGGQLVAPENSLSSAQITDGAVLRLAAEGELPPSPTVYDITEQAVEDLKKRGTTFRTEHRRVLAGAGLVFAVLAGAVAMMLSGPVTATATALTVVSVVAAAGGVVLGRMGHRTAAVPLLVMSTGTLAWTLGYWVAAEGWELHLVFTTAGAVIALGPLLFAAAGLAGGGVVASAAGLIFVVIWMFGMEIGGSADQVAVVAAVVAVLLLGLLPRLALALSGLTALDDRRAAGDEIARSDVQGALNAAHVGLALATVPIAVSSAVAGVLLVRHGSGWTVSIAVLLGFLLASRSRLYPLVSEVTVLFLSSAAVVTGFVLVASNRWRGGALIALGLLLIVATLCVFGLSYTPPDHVRARLTQLLDIVEVAAVIALVPLALGAFGVYGDLLRAF